MNHEGHCVICETRKTEKKKEKDMSDKRMTYKYADRIPMDVVTLETPDGDIRFQRKGKGWEAVKYRNWSPTRTYYNNDGDLLWEWAQSNPLRDATDNYAAAVDYLKNKYPSIAGCRPEHLILDREDKKHVHALIAKIQEEN